jgi:hypothetical protein
MYMIEGKAKTAQEDLPWEVLVQSKRGWHFIFRKLACVDRWWFFTLSMFCVDMTAFEADRSVGPRVGDNLRKEIRLVNVLSPWVAYEFRVVAANDFGYGIPSSPSPQYNTLPAKPFIAPRNVSGGGGKTNSLTITWQVMATMLTISS